MELISSAKLRVTFARVGGLSSYSRRPIVAADLPSLWDRARQDVVVYTLEQRAEKITALAQGLEKRRI